MELRVLHYFLTVAREQSITRAAQSLHLSQPTLSRQLMDLEAEIGKPLLIRGSRQIALTEEGMLLRKRAQEILDLVAKTENELGRRGDRRRRYLHRCRGNRRIADFASDREVAAAGVS